MLQHLKARKPITKLARAIGFMITILFEVTDRRIVSRVSEVRHREEMARVAVAQPADFARTRMCWITTLLLLGLHPVPEEALQFARCRGALAMDAHSQTRNFAQGRRRPILN